MNPLPVRPSEYCPMSPAEFIGPARNVARLLAVGIERAKASDNAPLKCLLNGDPGVGKSALAKFAINLLEADLKWSVTKVNGTKCTQDKLDEITGSLAYKDLYGRYRVVWIEEADAIPVVAQTRFLTLMDDLPNGAAVICTSNCKVGDFVKRFQTRFKMYEVGAPAPGEIQQLLSQWLPDDKQALIHISQFCCGNVRAAMLDAETTMEAAELKAA